jgi:hypothetical protein
MTTFLLRTQFPVLIFLQVDMGLFIHRALSKASTNTNVSLTASWRKHLTGALHDQEPLEVMKHLTGAFGGHACTEGTTCQALHQVDMVLRDPVAPVEPSLDFGLLPRCKAYKNRPWGTPLRGTHTLNMGKVS